MGSVMSIFEAKEINKKRRVYVLTQLCAKLAFLSPIRFVLTDTSLEVHLWSGSLTEESQELIQVNLENVGWNFRRYPIRYYTIPFWKMLFMAHNASFKIKAKI